MLGTFAAYYREPRAPQEADLKLLERVSAIAALAIEHVSMLDAIKESEARFDAFMRHSPAVSFIKDPTGHYLYGNPPFETLSGLSRGDLKAKTVFDFLPTEIATRISRQDKAVLTSGETLQTEETLPGPDGILQHWLVNTFPLKMGQYKLLGVAINITERKLLERANQDQADRLRLAMDIAKLATWDWNIVTNQIIWSENCEEVKGYPVARSTGRLKPINDWCIRKTCRSCWQISKALSVVGSPTVPNIGSCPQPARCSGSKGTVWSIAMRWTDLFAWWVRRGTSPSGSALNRPCV